MKKLFLVFSVFALVFSSCSSNEDTTPAINEDAILLKKLINDGHTIALSYNGLKISEVNFGSSKEVYTYSGDLITEIKMFNPTTNVVEYKYTYSYENNKLKTFYKDDAHFGIQRFDYTNNADGTVGYTITDINSINTPPEVLIETGTLTFNNGLLSKKEYNRLGYPANNLNVETYEYDGKNGLFKNVIGFDKIPTFYVHSIQGKQNVTKRNWYTLTDGVNLSGFIATERHTYTYDSFNFPITGLFYEAGYTSPAGPESQFVY